MKSTARHELPSSSGPTRKPQNMSSSSSNQPQTTVSASLHLEALARSMIEAINTRQLEAHPSSRYLDPNLQSCPDYSASPTTHITSQQYFTSLRQLISAYPQYQTHLTDVNAHVNLRAGYADVYTKTAVTGLPPGVVRNSVCVFEFRFRGNHWMCVKMTGIRGVNHDRRSIADDGDECDDDHA